MTQSNEGKYKVFTDGPILYGPPGVGQNLNRDIQENIGNELDATREDLLFGWSILTGLVVSPGAGLEASIAAGVAYIAGQRVATVGPSSVSGLPASTSGIKIYLQAAAPWLIASKSWTPDFGFTVGALAAGQVHLATITTDGSGVTAVTDARVVVVTLSAAEKAALGGTSGSPGSGNKYVTDADARNSNPRAPVAHGGTHASAGGDPVSHSTLAGLTAGDPHTQYAKKAGDTLTGPLVLPGNPTNPLEATPKQYVDAIQTSWMGGPGSPAFSTASIFTVTGDQSAHYYPGRVLRYKDTAGGATYQYTLIKSYSGGTVTVVDGALDSGLSGVQLANFGPTKLTFACTGRLPSGGADGLNLAGRLLTPELFEPLAISFYVEKMASTNGASAGNTTVRLRRGTDPAADGATDVLAAVNLAYNAKESLWNNPVHTEVGVDQYLQVDVTAMPNTAAADDLFLVLLGVPKWAKNL